MLLRDAMLGDLVEVYFDQMTIGLLPDAKIVPYVSTTFMEAIVIGIGATTPCDIILGWTSFPANLTTAQSRRGQQLFPLFNYCADESKYTFGVTVPGDYECKSINGNIGFYVSSNMGIGYGVMPSPAYQTFAFTGLDMGIESVDLTPITNPTPQMIYSPTCTECHNKYEYGEHDANKGLFVCTGCKLQKSMYK